MWGPRSKPRRDNFQRLALKFCQKVVIVYLSLRLRDIANSKLNILIEISDRYIAFRGIKADG
jgi:hypothetical protein